KTKQRKPTKIHGVVRMQMGQEHCPEIFHIQPSFVYTTSGAMATVDKIKNISNHDGGSDSTAALRLTLRPPARAARGSQRNDSWLQIGCSDLLIHDVFLLMVSATNGSSMI